MVLLVLLVMINIRINQTPAAEVYVQAVIQRLVCQVSPIRPMR